MLEKVISITQKRLEKVPTLKQLLKEDAELRGFFRFIRNHELRTRAHQLISKKIV